MQHYDLPTTSSMSKGGVGFMLSQDKYNYIDQHNINEKLSVSVQYRFFTI